MSERSDDSVHPSAESVFDFGAYLEKPDPERGDKIKLVEGFEFPNKQFLGIKEPFNSVTFKVHVMPPTRGLRVKFREHNPDGRIIRDVWVAVPTTAGEHDVEVRFDRIESTAALWVESSNE